MVFINGSLTTGEILSSGSTFLTGSEALTVLIFFVVLFLLGLLFRMPVIIVMLLCTPFVITIMAFNTAFFILGGVWLFIIAGVLTKMFFLS